MTPLPPPPAGLCDTCANVRIIQNRRGSRFYFCRMSVMDPRFPKYPGIPVRSCAGYVRAAEVVTAEEAD